MKKIFSLLVIVLALWSISLVYWASKNGTTANVNFTILSASWATHSWNNASSGGLSASWATHSWNNASSGGLSASWATHSWNSASSGGFSQEFVAAYDFAYRIWITTQKTIQDADVQWNLIRAHMAKMMATYAIEMMGSVVDTWRTCTFNDIGDQTEEMKSYIKLSCQLGIMWVGVTSFNPNWLVTRAEFGTVLSRILYGNTYNDWAFYYSNHLKILKEKWIIKDDNPKLEELRGYVMLMLMRAE